MLRSSEFNVLNFKAWNPDPRSSVFVCVCSEWGEVRVRGCEVIRSSLLQIKFHNVVKYNYVTNSITIIIIQNTVQK